MEYEEYFFRYGLHDTVVKSVEVTDTGLEFFFPEGVYFLNEKGMETEKTPSCKMVITIRDFSPKKLWQHIEIQSVRKHVMKEIPCREFMRYVKKYGMEICLNYLTLFMSAILLDAGIKSRGVYVRISEIESIHYIMQEDENS